MREKEGRETGDGDGERRRRRRRHLSLRHPFSRRVTSARLSRVREAPVSPLALHDDRASIRGRQEVHERRHSAEEREGESRRRQAAIGEKKKDNASFPPLLVLSLNLLLSNDLFLSRHPKETTGLVDHGLLTLNEGN